MISDGRQKYLRFVHQSAESLRVNDAVAVSLKFGTVDALHVRMITSLCIRRQKRILRKRCLFSFQKNITHIAHGHDLLFFAFSVFFRSAY
jgi:hypothetical protein